MLVQFDSHEKSLARGRTEIQVLVSQLNIRPRDDMTEASHRLYRLALQRNFTRGRRTNQVGGALPTAITAILCITVAPQIAADNLNTPHLQQVYLLPALPAPLDRWRRHACTSCAARMRNPSCSSISQTRCRQAVTFTYDACFVCCDPHCSAVQLAAHQHTCNCQVC